MGIFSRSKPHPETLAKLQEYNECFADVLECIVFIAEKLGYLTTAKQGRKTATLCARHIRVARSSSDKKACDVLKDFEVAYPEQLAMAKQLQEQYKLKYGEFYGMEVLEFAKKSGWKLM